MLSELWKKNGKMIVRSEHLLRYPSFVPVILSEERSYKKSAQTAIKIYKKQKNTI